MTTVLNDKTVLVIGHGLAGKTTVAALQRNGVRILVVESRNYYEPDTIAPLILSRSAVQATFTVPQSLSRVPGVEYIEGTVDTIDKSEGRLRVVLKTGEKISADAVVCCTGSTIPFLKPDLGAMPEERRNQLASARKAIAKAKTILVAGGGPVGIELAGAVCELKAQSAKVILAVSGETILHDGFPMGMRTRVAKVLTNAGVQILPNAKVTGSQIKASLTPSAYELSDGSTVNADVFLPSFSSFELPSMPSVEGATDPRGRLLVDGSLQSVKIPGVFAVACASVDKILNIPVVEGAAKVAAANACAFAHAAPLKQYKTKDVPAEPWLHFIWGEYSLLNLPVGPLSFCCGWPLPCLCCLPGCCMPCGYSCTRPEGKGVSQTLQKLMVDGKNLPHYQKMKSPGNDLAAPTPAQMVVS